MMEAGTIIAIIILAVLGLMQLDVYAKKHAAKKRVDAAKAHQKYEETLFKRNLDSLWQRPEKNEEDEEHEE